MAEKASKKERPFVKCWMYHSERGAVLFESKVRYDEAMKAGGWADHPKKLKVSAAKK